MHLPIGRWNGPPAPLPPEAVDFAEVVYEDDAILVVTVATDLADDDRLTAALIDAIATSPRSAEAELAIGTIAAVFELELRAGRRRHERTLVLTPRRLA
ncbi:MAG TPA: hypothetical protein VH723_02415 [Candidatus Limnocylindrales bacterium]|jgi:hypothetical protein